MNEIRPWSDGPPSNALPIVVYRQTYDVFDEPVLKQIHLPAGIHRENVAAFLQRRSGNGPGMKYTVFTLGTADVFEVDNGPAGFVAVLKESTDYRGE